MKNADDKIFSQFKGKSVAELEEYYFDLDKYDFSHTMLGFKDQREVFPRPGSQMHFPRKKHTKINRQREFSIDVDIDILMPKNVCDSDADITRLRDLIFSKVSIEMLRIQFRSQLQMLLLRYPEKSLTLLIRMLRILNDNSEIELWDYKEIISDVLYFLKFTLEQETKISVGLLASLAYLGTKLPICWEIHHVVLDKLFYFVNQLLVTLNREHVERNVSAYITLLGSLPKLSYQNDCQSLAAQLENIFKIICSMSTKFFSVSISQLHLLWQYCIWQFGTTIYHHQTYGVFFNSIEVAIKRKFIKLLADGSQSWRSSHFEDEIFMALKQILGRQYGEELLRQVVVGCFSLDFSIMSKKIVLEANGPHHYFGKSGRELRAQDCFRNYLLSRLGWQVIVIPYFSIQDLNFEKKKFFLRTELQKHERTRDLVKAEPYIPPQRR